MTKKLDEVCAKYNINDAQKRFAEAYVELANNTKAYLVAYPNVTEDTARVNGCKLLMNANIVQYIKDLRAKQAEAYILTVQEAQKILADIATDSGSSNKDKINALDKLLKSSGAYFEGNKTDTNINVTVTGSTADWSK